MKKCLVLLLAAFVFSHGIAQSYQADFQKYSESNDTVNQLKTLIEWEKHQPNDAELFTSFFNYYFNKCRDEILVVAAGDPPVGESYLELADSAGNYAGFIGSQINYEESYLKMALDKINDGIGLYPNRLDMRFGKIYVLGQVKDWSSFTKEIVKTIDYSAINDNQWTWTNNENLEDGKDVFLSSIQDYQYQIYNAGNDDLLVNMREIANSILKYYPNNVESLSYLSITYLLTGEYDKGLESLLKAEIINPKDHIVLFNIAHGYKLKGNKLKAIDYYKKVIEHGDEEAKTYAKQQIEELKK